MHQHMTSARRKSEKTETTAIAATTPTIRTTPFSYLPSSPLPFSSLTSRLFPSLLCSLLSSNPVYFSNPKMGSTGPDWRCPWCGRTCRSGYAPDGIGYPICSSGNRSCLWHQCKVRGVTTQTQYFEQALRRRFDRPAPHARPGPAPPARPSLSRLSHTDWKLICQFLAYSYRDSATRSH